MGQNSIAKFIQSITQNDCVENVMKKIAEQKQHTTT